MEDGRHLWERSGRPGPETRQDGFAGIGNRVWKMYKVGQNGYRLLNTGMLLGIVLAGAGQFLGIGTLSYLHVLTAAAVLIFCTVLQWCTVKGRAVCVLLTLVFLGVAALAAGVERSGIFLQSWLRWLTGQEGWVGEWHLWYELLQVVTVAFAGYGIQFILERFLVIRVLTADLVISYLLFCLLTEWEVPATAVAFSLCYIMVVYAEWIQREWDKVKGRDRKRYMLWIMPFMGLYFVLLLCMPTPREPYEWRFVKDTWSQIGESLIGLSQNFMRGGGDDFDTTLSGFSGDGLLQDELQENDREMMTVQGTGSLVTNVYLTGKVYDTFDGKGWQQKYHGTGFGPAEDGVRGFWDALQTQEAARLYEAALMKDQISAVKLRIRYKYFRTSCLFVPLKTREVRMERTREFYAWDGDNLLFREKRGYGTTYEVNYYQLNAGADVFDRFVRAVSMGAGAEDVAKDRTGAGAADADRAGTARAGRAGTDTVEADRGAKDRYGAGAGRLADAEKRRQQIYRVYTEDVELSEKTRQYVEELTAGAQDPLERLRRLEAELASFTYTKQPRRLPEEIESGGTFLEYFLLEGREGYCTHFATAFVLLARAQGMPARYVQGFCVPMKREDEVSVYGDMAHAWPEVYFDGVGWIPFEPTPGYAGLRYTPWVTEEGTGSLAVSNGDAGRRTTGDADAVASAKEELPAVEETPAAGVQALRFPAVFGYAALAVCVTGSGILALQQAIRRRRYRRMDVTGQFRMEVAVVVRALGFLGLRREEGETLQEFRERAVRGGTLQCISDYEEILYGEKAAEQEMLQTAVRERQELLAALRERKKWRYVLFWWMLTDE